MFISFRASLKWRRCASWITSPPKLANLERDVRKYSGWMKFSRVHKCAKTTAPVHTAGVWDYLEVPNTGQLIKDVVLECSKSILESTACLSRGKVEQTDRRALTSLTAESHSRLLIPPDTNSRLCFTFTSICRERREGKREAAQTLSHIRFLTFSICLSPTNFPSHGPPTPLLYLPRRSHSLSLSLPLSLPRSLARSLSLLPSLPPSSPHLWSFLRLCWDFLFSAALFSFNSTSEVYM